MSCFVILPDFWHSEQQHLEGIIFYKSEKFLVMKAMEISSNRILIILKPKRQNLQGQRGKVGVIYKWLGALTKVVYIKLILSK